jgi:hypothetical protein
MYGQQKKESGAKKEKYFYRIIHYIFSLYNGRIVPILPLFLLFSNRNIFYDDDI